MFTTRIIFLLITVTVPQVEAKRVNVQRSSQATLEKDARLGDASLATSALSVPDGPSEADIKAYEDAKERADREVEVEEDEKDEGIAFYVRHDSQLFLRSKATGKHLCLDGGGGKAPGKSCSGGHVHAKWSDHGDCQKFYIQKATKWWIGDFAQVLGARIRSSDRIQLKNHRDEECWVSLKEDKQLGCALDQENEATFFYIENEQGEGYTNFGGDVYIKTKDGKYLEVVGDEVRASSSEKGRATAFTAERSTCIPYCGLSPTLPADDGYLFKGDHDAAVKTLGTFASLAYHADKIDEAQGDIAKWRPSEDPETKKWKQVMFKDGLTHYIESAKELSFTKDPLEYLDHKMQHALGSVQMGAYTNEAEFPKVVIVAFRGTNWETSYSSLAQDLALITGHMNIAGFKMGTGPKQGFECCQRFARRVQLKYPDSKVYVTGHSLGGYFAEALASTEGFSGVSFNSPGPVGIINGPHRPPYETYLTAGDPIAHLFPNFVRGKLRRKHIGKFFWDSPKHDKVSCHSCYKPFFTSGCPDEKHRLTNYMCSDFWKLSSFGKRMTGSLLEADSSQMTTGALAVDTSYQADLPEKTTEETEKDRRTPEEKARDHYLAQQSGGGFLIAAAIVVCIALCMCCAAGGLIVFVVRRVFPTKQEQETQQS